MNVFSKTMPWLVSTSVVLTLAVSQNVSAQINNSQATSIKPVNKANFKQVNSDPLNLRMGYLDTSVKFALGDLSLPLPTADGLTSNHQNVNAYIDKGSAFGSSINFTEGSYPKAFNDPSLQEEDHYGSYPARDQTEFATFNKSTFDNPEKAQQATYYETPDQIKADISSDDHLYGPGEISSANLGNRISAITGLSTEQYGDGTYYTYNLYYYQGPYEIELDFSGKGFDNNAQTKILSQAKALAAKLKGKKFAFTDSHGKITYQNDNLWMRWSEGNNSYELSNQKGLDQSLNMFASVK